MGFTLLELLLVLVILVAMLGIGLPAMLTSLNGHRLSVSAEKVQIEFMRARVDAMESGRIRMFRFQPETGNFTVAPFIRSSDELENNLAGTSQGIGVSSVVMQSAEQETLSETLEEGVVFLANNVETDMRSYELAQEQGGDLELSGWSSPVLFYPDGTTSDAVIYLRGDNSRITSVKLRGLTGVARIVEPERVDVGE
ncbi:hypothetical protein [Blastopirellula marina]|uniref:General secretion pathway GspH domain-containing protein n=1 Tax=Blastopirellula marina TaxID=124 RepID=A0A2S8GDH6_9BACT|nr:hypothetical protein [Blastopirellula marina]PQO42489.1 hypothetical protein C5Y93_29630 [Blastopirellula marina]